eukprot:SAG11_NODE_1623_length_4559_cov_2.141480_4_plen_130_part_00
MNEVHAILVSLADKLQTTVEGQTRPCGLQATQAAKVLDVINEQQQKLRKLHGQLANPSKLQQQLYYPDVSAHTDQVGVSSDPGSVRPSFVQPKNATIFVDDVVRIAATDGEKIRHIDLEAVSFGASALF